MDGVIRSNVDYPTWLEKVRSELKQGDLSTYDYIWDGARISPFEEKKLFFHPTCLKAATPWHIVADINLDLHTNKDLLESLQLGAGYIRLRGQKTDYDWNTLFQDVHLDWIGIQVDLQSSQANDALRKYLVMQKNTGLKGIWWNLPVMVNKTQGPYFSKFSAFKQLTFNFNHNDTAADLAAYWNHLARSIESLSLHHDPQQLISSVAIDYMPGDDLVLNICMIRAMRLLWMQLLWSAGLDDHHHPIYISAIIKNNPDGGKYDHMIRSSALAVGVLVGGVDALSIEAPERQHQNPAWGIKTQYIMREESFFQQIADPLKGSFVIEGLTKLIVEKVWAEYIKLQEEKIK
ncbi:MAG: hypothetical protein IPJ09_13835 [Saprospiraceae bacterium]|nr:hypothetical protein [Saprospiraceae bacterium]